MPVFALRKLHIPLSALMVVVALLLASCSAIPREGPLAIEIERQGEENDYVIIDVNAQIVHTLGLLNPIGLSRRFYSESKGSPSSTIGIGDALQVTIWESGEGGLFSNTQSKNETFPAMVVDRRGEISLPYAGAIKVAGLTTKTVQERIIRRLDGQAIRPQVVVNVVKNEHNTVILNGDVNSPGRYPITLGGDRLLDVIASAGGTKFPARETYVHFIRGETQGIQLVNEIINDPAENIYVTRGDRIYLNHDPKRYTVLGAVKKPGIYIFEASEVNVLEAVASSGGLMDHRADASGLFVFRYENPRTLETLGIPYSMVIRGRVPTIYRIDMSHAKSYFYAQSFLLQDKDSVFVSNARTVEITKVLKLFNLATSTVGNVVGAGRNYDVLVSD